ncbi:MAG: pyruvate kinase, partial [Candidatus Hydrogenedentota bacterium]
MKSLKFRKTKIICTIGPATSDYEVLKKLQQAGMNIARLNMSHGDHKLHGDVIRKIRTLNRNTRDPIAILVDTQGPEIRTGNLEKDFTLNVGDEIDIAVGGGDEIETKSTIVVNYADMVKDLSPGDQISVDNGLINLEVIEKSPFGLRCRVKEGGVMKSRRHINLPGIRVNLPAITSKDEEDIRFAIEQEADFIALSFVRSATDIEECKRIIARHKGHAQVIAKIEDKFGVENMEEIIDAAYGVMVARGDLGVEVPIEEL